MAVAAHVRSDSDAGLEYWASELTGLQLSRLPFVPPGHRGHPDAELEVYTKRGAQRPRSHVTVPIFIRAAWSMIMGRLMATDDVAIACGLSGRNLALPAIETICGPTIVLVPVRVNLNDSQPVGRVLETLHRQSTDMIPWEHAGLTSAITLLPHVEYLLEGQLVVQPSATSFKEVKGVLVEDDSIELVPIRTAGVLTNQCYIEQDRIRISIQYDSALVSYTTMRRIAQAFADLIDQLMLSDPSTLLCDIEIPSRQQLLEEIHEQED
jgi:hypothetical protein